MEAILEYCDVKVDDIAIFEWSTVRNAVANDLINGAMIMDKIYVHKDLGNL
jgi:hypothetical protein